MRYYLNRLLCLLGLLTPIVLSAQADHDLARMYQNQDYSKQRLDSIYKVLIEEELSYRRDSLLTDVFYLHATRFYFSQKPDSIISELYKAMPYVQDDNPRKANVYELLGTTIYKTGDPKKAIAYYDTTLSLAKKFNNMPLQITMINRSSVLYNELGNRDKEIELLRHAITLADSTNSTDHQGTIRINLGIAFMESGLFESAIQSISKGINYIEEIANDEAKEHYLSYAYSNLGDIYAQLHQYDTAIVLCKKALEYTTEEDVFIRAYIANSLASTYQELEQYEKAKEQLDFAYPILSEGFHPQAKIGVATLYASVLIETGNYQEAQAICEGILLFADSANKYDMLVGVHTNLARALMYQNQLSSADEEFAKAFDFKDSVRTQFQDDAVAALKVEYDIAQSELENQWLKEENQLKDNIIKFSRIIILITVIALIIFGSLIIVINRNRKQLKKQQVELTLKNEALRELNQNNERILSLIAHDVKGPLASLEALISIQEKDDDYSSLETLTIAKGSISTLYNLVSSLLNWARKEKGLSQYEPSSIFLNLELKKIKDLYIHQLTFKKITFVVTVSDNVEIYADENMLHAVLRNIVTNAIKFTAKNGKITVSHKSTSEFDEVCVTDNGIGISTENLRLMQEGKITSQKGTNSELGTGLGVLFVRDIMAAHGGHLTIKSKQGEGSTFCLQFPRNKAIAKVKQHAHQVSV